MSEPDESDGNGGNGERDDGKGRDPKTGRFKKGCKPGPGRPRGTLQLQHLVKREVDKGHLDPQDAVQRLLQAMVLKGEQGDAQAAKVALDRLEPIAKRHAHLHAYVGVDGAGPGVPFSRVPPSAVHPFGGVHDGSGNFIAYAGRPGEPGGPPKPPEGRELVEYLRSVADSLERREEMDEAGGYVQWKQKKDLLEAAEEAAAAPDG